MSIDDFNDDDDYGLDDEEQQLLDNGFSILTNDFDDSDIDMWEKQLSAGPESNPEIKDGGNFVAEHPTDVTGDMPGNEAMRLAFVAAGGEDKEFLTLDDMNKGKGAVTAKALQLMRFSHVERETQIVAKRLLEGTLAHRDVGISEESLDEILGTFSNVIGEIGRVWDNGTQDHIPEHIDGSISDFAKQMHIPNYDKADPDFNPPKKNVREALSMLGKTSVEYMDRGYGDKLTKPYAIEDTGDFVGPRTRNAFESDVETMQDKLGGLADLYLTQTTKDSAIYGERKVAVQNELFRWITGNRSGDGWDATLPLPTEINVPGLVQTASVWGGNMTSPYGRREYAIWSDVAGDIGFTDKQIRKLEPSLQNTLFPNTEKRDSIYFRDQQDLNNILVKEALSEAREIKNLYFKEFTDDQFQAQGRDAQLREDLLNQASIHGLDRHEDPFNAGNTQLQSTLANRKKELEGANIPFVSGQFLKGTTKGGQYGEKYSSEQQTYINMISAGYSEEETLKYLNEGKSEPAPKEISNIGSGVEGNDSLSWGAEHSDRERYLMSLTTRDAPIQGSQEWLDQRRGMITASGAARLLSKKFGSLKVGLGIASEELGIDKPFEESWWTAQGTKYEEHVKRTFMSTAGKGLTFEEAFFETNKNLPGFGVSPDGRLYDKEGNSQGLAEFKWLKESRLEGALARYTPQMQMQMLVTGESQVHFFAESSETGKKIHEVVQADPEMQKALYERGKEAIAKSKDFRTAESIQVMEAMLMAGKKGDVISASTYDKEAKAARIAKAKEESRFVGPMPEKEETTQRFNPKAMTNEAIASLEGNEARDLLKQFVEQSVEIGKEEVQSGKMYDKSFVGPHPQSRFDKLKEEAEELAAAKSEEAAATKEAVSSLRDFKAGLKEASGVIAELTGLYQKGQASQMDEVRLAAKAGMDVEDLRSRRQILEQRGVKKEETASLMLAAGKAVADFADPRSGAKAYGDLARRIGASGYQDKIDMLSVSQMQNMSSGQDYTAWALEQANKLSPKEAVQFLEQVNQEQLLPAVHHMTKEEFLTFEAESEVGEADVRKREIGAAKGRQDEQEAIEATAIGGENTAYAVHMGSVAGKVLGSKTVGSAVDLIGPGKFKVLQGRMGRARRGTFNKENAITAGQVVAGTGALVGSGYALKQVLPDDNLGEVQAYRDPVASPENVNVTVVNKLSPELVETKTTVNGSNYMDAESTDSLEEE
jgi:hypothetical protein